MGSFKSLLKRILKRLDDMFFWFGIQLFDSKLKKYGGFNHFIAGNIFQWKYSYLIIELKWAWAFDSSFEENYYDGFHNYWNFAFLHISYGT